MIKTLIIDDEQHALDRLQKLLQDRCGNVVSLSGCASTVEDGLRAIENNTPDLIFLDIHLHDKTGFDLLRRLGQSKRNFELIFTTAYDQYAVQAFKCSALDFLLKPVEADDLEQAVHKVAEQKEKKDMAGRLDALLHNISSLQNAGKRICIPVMNGMEFVQTGDILRCQSEINYTHLFLHDKRKLLVPKTLKDFEELLSPFGFYRIHNSHIVNLRYVQSYTKGKGGYITMTDGSAIEVSTRRKEDFLKKLRDL